MHYWFQIINSNNVYKIVSSLEEIQESNIISQ